LANPAGRQRGSIFFRLPLGIEHQHVPGAVRATPAAGFFGNFGREQVVLAGDFLGAFQAAPLGFENETVLPVEVDAAMGVAFVLVLADGAAT
jgi:hypothetical protein